MKGDWPNVSSLVKQSSQNDGDFRFFFGGVGFPDPILRVTVIYWGGDDPI